MRVSEVNPGVDVDYRRMHRVFQMVSELHKVGYQGIRIYTQFYMSRRIWIAPAILVGKGDLSGDISESYRPGEEFNGELGPLSPMPGSLYFSGFGTGLIAPTNDGHTDDPPYYFGWDDASGCTAKQLANKFLERFPELTRLGLLDDLAYAGWLSRLIGEMEHGWYPVWINELGFIRLKPTSDRTRALEQRLTRGAIGQPEIDTLTGIGYSRPLEPDDADGLLGPGTQMRYLCSDGEGDDQQTAAGVYFTFPLPPPLNVDQNMLTSLLAQILHWSAQQNNIS